MFDKFLDLIERYQRYLFIIISTILIVVVTILCILPNDTSSIIVSWQIISEILTLLLCSMLLRHPSETKDVLGSGTFSRLVITVIAMSFFDAITLVLSGGDFERYGILLDIIVLLSLAVEFVPLILLTLYSSGYSKGFREIRFYIILPLTVWSIMLAINQVSPFVYYIDQYCQVVWLDTWYIMGLVYGSYLFMIIGFSVSRYLKAESEDERSDAFHVIVSTLYILSAYVIDAFRVNLDANPLMYAIALFYIYINVQSRRIEEYKNQISEAQTSTMLSQIQPHFLYNCLTGISALCDLDPPAAKKATIDFASYLRGNMNSLTATELIPFSQELSHVQHYISLEKMRFQDRVSVEYSIEAEDFFLPPLTLQPLVENAIKHGITKRAEGGTVRITTREENSIITIIIEDDGVGFDPDKPYSDGRTHVGLENATNRIKRRCGGTFNVESRPGEGTTITVTIPRGGIANELHSGR